MTTLGNHGGRQRPKPVELAPVLRQVAELVPVLRQLADRLADEGERAVCRAYEIAARGYPSSTNGSEGGRSSDPTSSTERAALNPSMFDDIDGRLKEHLRVCGWAARKVHDNLNVIMSHAPDDDPVPPGAGKCPVAGCGHNCNPRKKPDDRLRAGYCPKHYRRWCRLGRPDRGMFERYIETEDVA